MTRRRTRGVVVLTVAVWAAAVSLSVSPAQAQRETPAATPDLSPVITQYCAGCHNERARTTATASGVVLDKVDLARVADNGAMWEKVIRKLRAGAMPPAGMPRPDAATHDALVSFLGTTLDRAAMDRPNPGRQSPHRLNRAEYANAIRDLLALDVDPATLLPPDDSADGFDNNADVLSVSPVLLERYLSAAATVSALAVGDPRIIPGSETYRIRGDASQTGQNEELTYALGRTLEPEDMPAVRAIVRTSARDGYRFSAIVRGIVSSVPFQMRRARDES